MRCALGTGVVLAAATAAVKILVEREAPYVFEELGGAGPERALVLNHPSRDARFSDQLSLALADGLRDAGLAVDRATLTRETPARPDGYAIVAVVGNTYFWTPDVPTLRYLRRAELDGVFAAGVMGGAGSTGRAERMLGEALRNTGARVLETRSLWILRPNDESRMDEPNRSVAEDIARALGAGVGTAALNAEGAAR